MTRTLLTLSLTLGLALPAAAQGWLQWGRNASHQSASPVIGQKPLTVFAEVEYDKFAEAKQQEAGGSLLVHYQAPIVDGGDVFMMFKGGSYTGMATWETQTWNVKRLSWSGGSLAEAWNFESDWKPVPRGAGGPGWEPVFHPALAGDVLYVPGAGGTVFVVRRDDGGIARRANPFGETVDATIFVTGPITVDGLGNVYWNAVCLAPGSPWGSDVVNSWLVKMAPGAAPVAVPYSSIVTGAPAATAPCLTQFSNAELPWPPSPTAVPPTAPCGSQRPGINVAPAVAPDGTIYTVSRAHWRDRQGYLVAVNPDLTPKWTASLRDRLNDGCDVLLPPNGAPGGCRAGALRGVDPGDNTPGGGRVLDDSSSSPAVAPDGSVYYGAYTRYNYSAGHLMKFSASGEYLGSYPFGWDFTPTIWEHDGTYSLLMKENHYGVGSYCSTSACPPNRTIATPNDPEQYFISQVSAALQPEWKFKSTNQSSCSRLPDGSLSCVKDHPWGFEWCVNAAAVDAVGTVYANSEDGNLYAIGQGGILKGSHFLQLALGAAYTPLSIGPDGRIYTQNAGILFVVGQTAPRRARAVER